MFLFSCLVTGNSHMKVASARAMVLTYARMRQQLAPLRVAF